MQIMHLVWAGPYNPKPSLKFGVEISTFTHAFQIYVGNAAGILPQLDMMNNMNKPFEGLAFGFTITRLWMFINNSKVIQLTGNKMVISWMQVITIFYFN